MPNYSTNYNLYLPNRADTEDVDTTLSTNFTKIDSEIKKRADETQGVSGDVDLLRNEIEGIRFAGGIYPEGINHILQFKAVGDGITDDSEALQNAFDASEGKTLILQPGKVYGIPNSRTVTIKPFTTIITNGAKFKKLDTGSNYVLSIGANVYIDYLEYVPFWSASETGVIIKGNNVTIDRFVSIASSPGCGGDTVSRNALFIDGSAGQLNNVKIGYFLTKNWDRAFQCRNATGVLVEYFDIDIFKLGVYLRDVKNSIFPGAYIRGLGPNSDGNPGQNGVLFESYVDYGCRGVQIKNWVVEDTGEHGYRIGGQLIAADITFENCISRRPGRGTVGDGGPLEGGVGHGGCGFKALGPTSNSTRHRNIRFINCTAEDGRTDIASTKLNFAGFYIGKCLNVTIENPVVRTNGVSVSDRSFANGIEIIGCEDVTISNPNIAYTTNNGIHIFDLNDGVNDFGTFLSRINITGGLILNPVNAGILVNASNYTFRRIRINGTIIESILYGIQAIKTGTGTFDKCSVSCYLNPTNSSTTIDGLDLWLVDVTGVFTATPNNAANGSTFRGTDGTFKVRKAGAWSNM